MLPTLVFVLSVGRGLRKFRFGVTEANVEDGDSVVVVEGREKAFLAGNRTLLLDAVLTGDFVVFPTDDGRNGFNGFLRTAFSFSLATSLFFNNNL